MTNRREPQQLEWEQSWLDCQACPDLVATRNNVVLGSGNPQSRLVFVGRGPEEYEDLYGEPFIGKAGSLLKSLLARGAGLGAHEYFLENVIMCRATLHSGEELKDRKPSAAERLNCYERLMGALYTLDPILIVALGSTALQVLTGNATAITRARGTMFHLAFSGVLTDVVYPVFATYHPNYLNKRQAESKVENGCWDQMVEDLRGAVYIYDLLRERYFGIKPPDRTAQAEQHMEYMDE